VRKQVSKLIPDLSAVPAQAGMLYRQVQFLVEESDWVGHGEEYRIARRNEYYGGCTMTRKTTGKHTGRKRKASEGEISKLIESARKQPGVQEVMAVYEKWKTFDASIQSQRRVVGIHRIISLSSSSVPPSNDE
jgi:hypothetical protein